MGASSAQLWNGRGLNRRGYRGVLAALAQFALQTSALALQAVSLANRRNVCFALFSQLSFEFGNPPFMRRLLHGESRQSGVLRLQRGFRSDRSICNGNATRRDTGASGRLLRASGKVRQDRRRVRILAALQGLLLVGDLRRGLRLGLRRLDHRLRKLRKI